MKNKKKLAVIGVFALGVPLLAVSTNIILKQARDNYYKEQKIKMEMEKAQQKAKIDQELARQKAEKQRIENEKKQNENKNIINEKSKNKNVVNKNNLTSQEKSNEKVKEVISNARKQMKPIVAYEPVSNVVAKSEITSKDRAKVKKFLKSIRADYFSKNKAKKLKNNETLIVKTSNKGIETKKYSDAKIQKALKEIRENINK